MHIIRLKEQHLVIRSILLCFLGVLSLVGSAQAETPVIDALGNPLALRNVQHVICSGPGCLRLLVYLEAQDRVVAVDDIETKRRAFDARPYALANPQLKKLPTFGEFRGHDNPERILLLNPQPQVIFKTYPTMGHDAAELQQKTDIPVIPLNYGDLTAHRSDLYASLRIMGEVLGKQERAEAVIAFFDDQIHQLAARTKDIPDDQLPTVYIGGVAHKGPHGYQSTEPAYPPFLFVKTLPVTRLGDGSGKNLQHADIAKEKIVEWNPDYLFLDLSTLQLGESAGALYELRTDPAYATLTARKNGKVYGVLPYNWYTQNCGSTLADAWFVGKLLYPDRFEYIDPVQQADTIYTFLVNKPVFAEMNALFNSMAFRPIPMQ
ncbi:iron ABC transporter substrate-binding protein [Desulfovibrio inopinatus]|uniref:iron ABC transporter substrate-binding protein n=1 Tax=Desulfovibrio inopinatus TaxID=102109 RepID=UPI000407D0B2|nr:iron ABC transporter substrate-binding protein [Desulfovibrio inopinatus]